MLTVPLAVLTHATSKREHVVHVFLESTKLNVILIVQVVVLEHVTRTMASVLITVRHAIIQDVQNVIPATTDKPASLLAVKIARMDAINSMANVLAAKITDMDKGAITFALQFVLCASKIIHALCVMPDYGVTCAPQTVVLDVRMESVTWLMAVAYVEMDGKEASVMNV